MSDPGPPEVLRLTLDTNCVLDAVTGHPFGTGVEELARLCGQGGVELWLTTAWDQDQETAIRSPRGGPKISWGGPPLTPATGKYRLRFDLAPPADGDQRAEVDRPVSLGATRADIGQGEVSWVVMADPDGHEFCVLTPLPSVTRH